MLNWFNIAMAPGDMKDRRVKPDVQTLCNYLKVTSSLAFNKNVKGKQGLDKLARSVMAEFRDKLGVEPSLGCYYYYILTQMSKRIKLSILDVIKILEDKGKPYFLDA